MAWKILDEKLSELYGQQGKFVSRNRITGVSAVDDKDVPTYDQFSSGFVPTTRVLTASTDLVGLGDLSADRTVSHATSGVVAGAYTTADVTVNARGHITAIASGAAVPTTRNLTAGNGLTGGGDLSADRTFTVGAGTGISVSADAVAIADTAVTPASYKRANFTVDQQGRLTAASSGQLSHCITIETVTASEDWTIFFTNAAITISEMRAVIRGAGAAPDVTWTIRFASDRSAAGTEVVNAGTTTSSGSTGSDVTVFNDATIPADNFVWLETTAITDTINELHVTIVFSYD